VTLLIFTAPFTNKLERFVKFSSPESMLFDTSIHTKSNNDICNSAQGENVFGKWGGYPFPHPFAPFPSPEEPIGRLPYVIVFLAQKQRQLRAKENVFITAFHI